MSAFVLDRTIKHDLWFAAESGPAWPINPELNRNIAFSIPVPSALHVFFIPLLVGITLALGVTAYRSYRRNAQTFFWWGLLTAGALSNVLDRILLGGVFDYIDLGFFPVFNVSDAYIVASLVAFTLLDSRRRRMRPE
ncbi:MAG: hypothetical protein A3B30_02275 [Candidatus Komeilibacteria bacterium RIFCSPLOWO2_01_FULL_52_15]|uniref:Uncharacterized protein n=2 Tax=Candidatus Komeiliibacteriota TaxID=1817908 RepID=A0A1G2BS71_9BACT|nr:MAG: hypothetical protein A2677_03805 [Candidatus Komeilibacteria bacterium RIFCSPHIGHO2_01_FULL_52_14]OGY91892.1 MAG: hypothetical protein A3B30_02275 [Candidatus Komeilibacteria bacterium RIFCSPLOWO2_01_FULL_52_15]